MPQRIMGIDLGSWSVKAVLLETGFRGFQVQRVAEVKLPPAVEGEESSLAERQTLALTELLSDETFRADLHVSGFPGQDTAIRFVRMPLSDTRKIDQVMEGELEDLVPIDLFEGVYHYQVLERRPERGKPGSSLSLAAAARKEAVRSYLRRLEEAEIDPKFLPVDVLSLYNLYTHFLEGDGTRPMLPGEPDLEGPPMDTVEREAAEINEAAHAHQPGGRLLVDIGHARTLVLAASPDGIAHARVIRSGGQEVTRAIARAYGLSWTDAEAGKHDSGALATSRHPAPSEDAQHLSNVIAQGLAPLVRELRRTLANIRHERRVEITRIDLLGGGARIENLAHHLAEALGLPVGMAVAVEQNVEAEVERDRRPAFAGALAAALRTSGDAATNELDLRRGELAFSGGLQHLQRRVPIMAAAVATLLVLLGVYGILRMRAVDAREAEVNREFCRITETVIGREICEPDLALTVMRNPPSDLGNFQLPETSAYDLLRELSARAPKDGDIKVVDVNIDPEKVLIEGEAASFDAVDSLVVAYGDSRCFQDIGKDRLRKKTVGEGVEFRLKMKVGCD